MLRIPAVMLATGSVIGLLARLGRTQALKVLGIVCMRPCEGLPDAALLSQLLIALGLPPDSCMMIVLTPFAKAWGNPISPSALAIQPSRLWLFPAW